MDNFKVFNRDQDRERANRSNKKRPKLEPFFAKVVSIRLTGMSEEVGKIFFQPLSNTNDSNLTAVPFSPNIKLYPVVGETVLIYPPADGLSDHLYTFAANTQNTVTTQIVDSSVSSLFPEREDINPLIPFPGDFMIEGRQGQSIRFTQNIEGVTPWSGSNPSSVVVIANGQQETDDSRYSITEDINKTPSSLFMTENSFLTIEDSAKRDSYGDKEAQPLRGPEYGENQIALTSGRLYFKANKDSILLDGSDSICLSSKEVHVNATTSIKALAEEDISLEDQNWRATLTEILDLIEMLGNGGNITDGAPTGKNIAVLEKLRRLRKSIG